MTVQQIRELICDCRHKECLRGQDRCGYAITDYATSIGEIRDVGDLQGWGFVNGRDVCPGCRDHERGE